MELGAARAWLGRRQRLRADGLAGASQLVPVRLLPQLVQHLQRTGAAATVLAPHWPAQPWFAPLAALASDTALLPPGTPAILLTPFSPMPECKRWRLIAFSIPLTPAAPPAHSG